MQLEKEWVKRPVIYLSMSLGGSSAQTLREYLHSALSAYEKIYGRNPDEQSLGNRLNGIIQRAYEQSGVQIAVIVDEYDVPLQHTFETDHHDECREIYRNFFTGLKDYGYCIKCVFVTGITKFTQISLFSMLNTLNRSRLNSYWIASGSNEMLNKLLGKFMDEVPSLDGSLIDADYLEMSDVNMDEPKLFLYQSGYLTIKAVRGDYYELGYPNREVRKAMYELVLPMMMHKQCSEVNSSIQKLKMHLGMGKVDEAMLCLKSLIAGTPYSTQKKEHFVFEEHFRFILKNIFYLCGFEVKEELEMWSGVCHRADEISPLCRYLCRK